MLDQLLLVEVNFLIVVRVLHCLQIDLLEILSAASQSIQNVLFLAQDVRVFLSYLKFGGFIFGFICLLIAHSSQESSIIRFLFLLLWWLLLTLFSPNLLLAITDCQQVQECLIALESLQIFKTLGFLGDQVVLILLQIINLN